MAVRSPFRSAGRTKAMMLLKEPMLHFAIAGALLFAAQALLDRNEGDRPEAEPIRVGEGEVRWLRETFTNQWQRPPTPEELSGLVANLVEEELLAREALALGLDQGDTVVRRRLAQKLAFLIEDTSRLAEPTDEDLRDFYTAQLDRFRTEPRVSLTQVFFSDERRQNAQAVAAAALVKIAAGQDADPAGMGDPLPLEDRFESVDRQALASLFGAEFADAVLQLAPGSWEGPIRSSFGQHLVHVTHTEPARIPPFDSIRGAVMREWRQERETEIKAAYLGKLREKHDLVVESSVKVLLSADALGGAVQ